MHEIAIGLLLTYFGLLKTISLTFFKVHCILCDARNIKNELKV